MIEYYDYTTSTWSTNPKYQEILRLDRMLTEADIPHTLERSMDGWQVCYPVGRGNPNIVMDAIEHYGSYGREEDRLEIMGLLTPEEAEDDDVLGHLTAEDVFERIRKHYNGEWNGYIESLVNESSEDTPNEQPSNTPMTPEEFTAKMQMLHTVCEEDDQEEGHMRMDILMCDVLRQLGYGEGVDIFEATPMWYA